MEQTEKNRAPIKAGLLNGDLNDLSKVHLAGTKCSKCGEVSLGTKEFCSNCGSSNVSGINLDPHGKLWSYTIVRHKPPGNFKGATDPFVPFAVGLVELPDGIRVYSTLSSPIDDVKIGDDLIFSPFVRQDEDGSETVAFTFAPVA